MYFAPAFSPVSSVRAVNAITRPLSLQMGNITRLRNRSYSGPCVPSSCSFELNSPEARNASASAMPLSLSRSAPKLSGEYPIRNFSIPFGSSPRPARYSRATAPSGPRNCSSKNAAAASCRSSSFRLSRASAASSGDEYSFFGSGIPHFCATIRTASGKLTFSIFTTKLNTSPDTPHPKQ